MLQTLSHVPSMQLLPVSYQRTRHHRPRDFVLPQAALRVRRHGCSVGCFGRRGPRRRSPYSCVSSHSRTSRSFRVLGARRRRSCRRRRTTSIRARSRRTRDSRLSGDFVSTPARSQAWTVGNVTFRCSAASGAEYEAGASYVATASCTARRSTRTSAAYSRPAAFATRSSDSTMAVRLTPRGKVPASSPTSLPIVAEDKEVCGTRWRSASRARRARCHPSRRHPTCCPRCR